MLRIGGKACRGVKGSKNAKCEGFRNIDVTSGSRVKLGNTTGRDFSPLVGNLKVYDNGREFQQFENWWQGNKVYKHLGHVKKHGSSWITTKKFDEFQTKWANQTKGKRVIPETKENGRRTKPLFAIYDGKYCNYADARWHYTSKYCQAVKNTTAFTALAKMYQDGEPIMLIDHDGPPSTVYPAGRTVDWNTINDAFTDLSRPYGHSYVIAAMLLNTKDFDDTDDTDESE